MTKRITLGNLIELAELINQEFGIDADKAAKRRRSMKNFHVIFTGANYGRYWLSRETGCNFDDNVFGACTFRKTDLFNRMLAYYEGVRAGKKIRSRK